jgi:hypothetical protein
MSDILSNINRVQTFLGDPLDEYRFFSNLDQELMESRLTQIKMDFYTELGRVIWEGCRITNDKLEKIIFSYGPLRDIFYEKNKYEIELMAYMSARRKQEEEREKQ